MPAENGEPFEHIDANADAGDVTASEEAILEVSEEAFAVEVEIVDEPEMGLTINQQTQWQDLLEPTSMRLTRSAPVHVPDPQTPVPDPVTPLPVLPAVVPAVTLVPRTRTPAKPPARAYPRGPLSLSAAQRGRRHRKVVLRHYSRKHIRAARARERRSRLRMWTIITSTVVSLLLIFVSLGSAAAYVAYRFVNTTQHTFDQQLLTIRDLLPPDNLKIYDSKGVLLDQLTDNGIHTTVAFDQIAPDLRNATVATEDKNFWYNEGVDPLGIIRAFLTNLQDGRVVEGGSTITQQLIKNLIVGNSSTIVRKLEEVVLAPQLNSNYSKQDILAMYLNTIYYGHQAYGIDAAANVYFGLRDTSGHSAAYQLDLAQSALLAALPSNPSRYDPLVNFQGVTNRFESVLGLMYEQGYITNIQRYDAIREEQGAHFFKINVTLANRAPHYINLVLIQLQQMFHMRQRSDLSRSGLVVYTTLNISLQDKIQKIMQEHIAELRNTNHVTNSAEVLIDFHTGAVLSLLGSINYYDNSIDGQVDVTQAYRQPGSSFKPYVYVTAFAQGASPAQAIDDKQTTFSVPDSNPDTFTPSNYDQRFHGHITLRCALQNSLNVPGVLVLNHAGVSNALQTAKNMGITSYQGTPGLSMVLGGLGIRLIDHTSAMGTFADGGVHVPYYYINKVVMATTGQVMFQHQTKPGVRVISPQLAYMTTNVLSDNTDRLPEFFDCNVLQLYSNSQQDCWNGNRGTVRPAAAKTGTTNDFKDNWTVGYTTDFVMGVWAGNNDDSPMVNVSGITGAAPIWHDAMLLAEQGHPIRDFTYPGGLERATVTYPDGVTSTDWFLPGTVPTFTYAPSPTPTSGKGKTPAPTTSSTPSPVNPPPSSEPTPAPYCPSYSFAFPPPPNNVQSPDPGWW